MKQPKKTIGTPTEQQARVKQLRDAGMTFKEIGSQLGISASYAHTAYKNAERNTRCASDWAAGLSVRAVNCLNNVGANSKDEAQAKYLSGALVPGKTPRCYGWGTHQEIAAWLSLPIPEPPKPAVKTCPHCGGVL